MESRELEAHLRTLGVGEAVELALDATITPDTLLGRGPSAVPALSPPPSGVSVGPLPRIALSGLSTPPAAAVAARLSAAPGEGLADLEIIGVLGEGGMGRVHLARQRSLGREVAIKTLKQEVADVRSVELLRAEATTMGRLEHPNVVPVHAVGRDDTGQLLLVMKRIDGVSWRDLLRDPAHPRWPALAQRPEDRLEVHLDVLAQVSNALHFAHGRGVVHRDVKPENVLLGEHGEVYLADWGIAKKLGPEGPTELVGTPAYMAPEMVAGDPARIDARTDVFLLGATLHEVLTGAPPHDGANLHAALLHAYEAPPPSYAAGVPHELAAIATRAMSARSEERFPTALAFRQALDERRRHAGAIALTRSARALLAELEGARGSTSSPEVDRRLTECRFAFVQALREWPESTDARAGLDAVLRLAIRNELARDNAAAARGLLAELSAPDAALEAQLSTIEATLATRRAESEKLRAIVADEDLRVGLRSRMGMFGALIAVALAISVFITIRTGGSGDALGGDVVVGIATIFTSIIVLAVVILRRHLLGNAAGRRVVTLLLVSAFGLLFHRVMGAAHGVAPGAILSMDLVLLAVIAGASGVIVPRVGWAAVFPLAGAGLTLLFPEAVPLIFSAFGVLTLVAVAGLWLYELRSRAGAPPSGG